MIKCSRRFCLSQPKKTPKSGKSYSDTLLLPKTSFSPKIPNGADRARLIETSGINLYKWQAKNPKLDKVFTIHDGPPYANGDLHLGHALNKILKDIINRFELLYNGALVRYRPGWDCHGLPIEMKAAKDAGMLSASQVRSRCRELALSMIDRQREQFLQFGIMTDFENPYVTMSHDYEAAQLRVFLKLFENGLLSRHIKPVWWGCETQTALAEAELEYNNNHKSVAIFVKFPLQQNDVVASLGGKVHLLIWTSTPWTMPANKAICVNERMEYTVLEDSGGDKVVVAMDLADSVAALNPDYTKTNVVIMGSDLVGMKYTNPSFATAEEFPVLHGDHVVAAAGTGLVHNAPAHGMEDYLVALTHGLKVESSVDSKGLYVESVLPPGYKELASKYANGKSSIFACLKIIEDCNMLFHVNKNYIHSYPYDWRSKTPVIQRATPQWFINVDKIKNAAQEALDKVEFVPPSGRNRLSAFVKNRSEWCISRQRSWGVPLPIVYSKKTDEPVLDLNVVKTIVERINEFGTDAWFEEEQDISRWLPESMQGEDHYKGTDTMDVWFDSGTSWSTLQAVGDPFLAAEPLADIYLEGSDQHRGWFQSSLLNKIIALGRAEHGHLSDATTFAAVAPYKKIITHGFTLDKNNDKMSKSKGNTIVPARVTDGGGKPNIPAMGTDGLRLWVASSTYTSDVSVSVEVLQRVFENVKKLRVTFKYILGNLQTFSGSQDLTDLELSKLDRYILSRLVKLQNDVVDSYKSHNFARVVRLINTHMSGDLSALYFDISKDTLYTASENSQKRKSIQQVLDILLRTYVGLLSPIQPLLTQEVWLIYAEKLGLEEKSPFMKSWDYYQLPAEWVDELLEEEFSSIWLLRDALYKKLEELRLNGVFKNKLETEVFITGDETALSKLREHSEGLEDYFLVSRVTLGEPAESEHSVESEAFGGSVKMSVRKSSSCKCPRCWKYIAEHEHEICHKCAETCI